jgi:hypothetical protein
MYVIQNLLCVAMNEKANALCFLDTSPLKYANAPISLQVSGRRFNEEKVIFLADEISQALSAAATSHSAQEQTANQPAQSYLG